MKILVVDNDEYIVRFMMTSLEMEGYEATVARSDSEAVENNFFI